VLASTDLKVGERVKLIGEKEASVRQVVEVRYGAFRTDSQAADGKVFVYGREVKDFRFVDYEAISMLNVSATQELAKKLEAQQAELKKLEAKFSQALAEKETLHKYVALLEERDRAREERLARMESSLAKSAATSSYASVAHP